jgi:VanZ family protein
MRIERWSMGCALLLVAQIFTLGALPFELGEPWDKVWHFLAYGALTLLLWIATGGRRPVLVVAAVMLLGGIDELRQAWLPERSADPLDFLADLAAAFATAACLGFFSRRKTVCAESSAR